MYPLGEIMDCRANMKAKIFKRGGADAKQQ
jgi:hypothetical protein